MFEVTLILKMSLSKAKKLVLVEIIQGTNLTEVEIDISKFKSCDLADVDKTSLVNGLCTKKPALSDYFKHKDTSFKVESECFPGRFVEIGDQSPISSKIVRCVIPQTIRQPFKDLTATTNETPDRGSHLLFKVCYMFSNTIFSYYFSRLHRKHFEISHG